MCSVAVFLSEKEKKLSRLVSAHPSSLDPEDFCCNLYLQGFVVVSECVCVWVHVCEFVWVWVCGTESSSHHKHLSLYSHTTNLSIHTFYYCQTSKITKCWGLHTYTQSGESSYLPFTMADIRQSDLPPCIIHISGTCKEVNQTHYTLCIYFVPISLLCVS